MKKFYKKAIAMMCMVAMVVSSGTGAFAAEKNLEDGTYKASAYINASMMKIAAEDHNTCTVTVKDGKAVAHVRLNGDGYGKLFLGTKEEAEVNKDATKEIPEVVDKDGRSTYEVPLEEFGKVFDLAAYSKSRERWYDRKIVFYTTENEAPEITTVKRGTKALEVKWTSKPDHATGYQLYVSATGNVDEPDEWRTIETKANSCLVKGLDPGEKVYLRVKAEINPFGDTVSQNFSDWSQVKAVTTLSKVAMTTVKSVTSPAKKTLKVTWAKKTADVTGYQIMYSTKSNFKGAKTVTVKKNTVTSYKQTKLKSGNKYYVKVRTYQQIGSTKYTSAWSAAKNVKVK